MIVKNESAIIERCLNACKPAIDFVSICDTGSSDHTPDVIKNWCTENEISCAVHHEQFVNFGHNRSLAVSLAQSSFPEADYLLLLDADMVLSVDPRFDKSQLTADHYLVELYDGRIRFWLTVLVKACLPWKSVGVTHEYWDVEGAAVSRGKLDSLSITDVADGGSRSDKFERDKRLLTQGIRDPATRPDLKVRYMFYLAQTHFCLGEFRDAIQWYKERVAARGWVEEVYYSLTQIGLCYEGLANEAMVKREHMESGEKAWVDKTKVERLIHEQEECFALAVTYLQNAWEYRPCRAEPLYHLARMHRIKSSHNVGLMYALRGKDIPFPKDDILFVDYHVYTYLFDYEISICAYYCERDLGRLSLQRLRSKIDELPPDIAANVESNSKFYM